MSTSLKYPGMSFAGSILKGMAASCASCSMDLIPAHWSDNTRMPIASGKALERNIDDRGRVVAQLPLGSAAVLSGVVHPTTGLTPFARFGHVLVMGLAVAMVVLAALAARASGLRKRSMRLCDEKSP